mgnify:CR=1 FL=1
MRAIIVGLALLLSVARVGAQPATSERVEAWRAAGQYFTWTSTLPENAGRPVQVFYTCAGDASKPAMLMVHGFPTSSLDFAPLVAELKTDFRVCTLDFPGYGLSDKPAAAVAMARRSAATSSGSRLSKAPAQETPGRFSVSTAICHLLGGEAFGAPATGQPERSA